MGWARTRIPHIIRLESKRKFNLHYKKLKKEARENFDSQEQFKSKNGKSKKLVTRRNEERQTGIWVPQVGKTP